MKRDQLKDLQLTEEQIEQIMIMFHFMMRNDKKNHKRIKKIIKSGAKHGFASHKSYSNYEE